MMWNLTPIIFLAHCGLVCQDGHFWEGGGVCRSLIVSGPQFKENQIWNNKKFINKIFQYTFFLEMLNINIFFWKPIVLLFKIISWSLTRTEVRKIFWICSKLKKKVSRKPFTLSTSPKKNYGLQKLKILELDKFRKKKFKTDKKF